jgi:hypothetical protein
VTGPDDADDENALDASSAITAGKPQMATLARTCRDGLQDPWRRPPDARGHKANAMKPTPGELEKSAKAPAEKGRQASGADQGRQENNK